MRRVLRRYDPRIEERAIAVEGVDALMQRAAAAVATSAADLLESRGGLYGRPGDDLVGPGNNGGDALFAGARLARRGARVTAVRCLGGCTQPDSRPCSPPVAE